VRSDLLEKLKAGNKKFTNYTKPKEKRFTKPTTNKSTKFCKKTTKYSIPKSNQSFTTSVKISGKAVRS